MFNISISHVALSAQIKRVIGAVDRRAVQPILKGFKLTAEAEVLSIIATDLDHWAESRVRAQVVRRW